MRGSFRSVAALVADIFRFLDHHISIPNPTAGPRTPTASLKSLDHAWEALLEGTYNPNAWYRSPC